MARRKGIETAAPERLQAHERARIREWAKQNLPPDLANGRELHRQWEECRNHHEARGNQFVSWPAAFRKWLIRSLSFREQANDLHRVAQEHKRRKGETEELAKVLDLFKDAG